MTLHVAGEGGRAIGWEHGRHPPSLHHEVYKLVGALAAALVGTHPFVCLAASLVGCFLGLPGVGPALGTSAEFPPWSTSYPNWLTGAANP
jgi:hypothetical protein